MAENSKIEWTDHTFNPWMGCTKVSAGCKHCYAETLMDHRYKKVQWGPQGTRVKTSVEMWRKPYRWNKDEWSECLQCGWRGCSDDAEGVCAGCGHPKWAVYTKTRQRVFCASLADVFEDNPQLVEWRVQLFDLIETTPNLDWLVLTKRPENVLKMVPQRWLENWWLDHLWIGASVENQEQADKRIPELVKIPARVKFLSCEPLLEKVDLDLRGKNYGIGNEFVNWVICGGESGAGARTIQPDWVRSIRDQCTSLDIPFFFKQWGEYLPVGGPEQYAFEKVGKHRAGAVLDGVTWKQYPNQGGV